MEITKSSVFVCLGFLLLFIEIDTKKTANGILSRRKRYVAFPDGSTVIFAYCVVTDLVTPFTLFTEGVNWGVSYDLPNATAFTTLYDNKPKFVKRRRHRRDLYNKIEIILDSMGYDGRSCILLTLCEAGRNKKLPTKTTLSDELIHLLFKFPQQTVFDFEPDEHRLYHWAYRQGRENKQQDCRDMFPECSISLLDHGLGYYNDYMEELKQISSKHINQ